MIRRIIISIHFFLFFSLFSLINAQPIPPKFEKLSLDNNGASLYKTYCMIQDRKGFLWFGTMYGLVKYDGRSFKIFKNDPSDSTSISFDDIISLYEDRSGNIWIGTNGGGLNELNPITGKSKRFIYDPANYAAISGNIIRAIAEDTSGNIWIGTQFSGLNKFDPKTNKFSLYKYDLNNPNGLLNNTINTLYVDNSETLWIGSRGGLSKYLPKQDKFYTYINDHDNPNSISSNVVFSIMDDSNGNLWIGTANGLNSFDKSSNSFSVYTKEKNSLSDDMVLSISKDKYGDIWAGTPNGLNRLIKKTNTFENFFRTNTPNSLAGNNIISLLEDKTGVLWIDAYQNGINKFINIEDKFPLGTSKLNDEKVTSFAEDKDGYIWIGTLNRGLFQFNPVDGNLKNFLYQGNTSQISSFDRINCINIRRNTLWIGTRGGLVNFNLSTNRYSGIENISSKLSPLSSMTVTSIMIDKLNQIWLGTNDNGIFVYNDFKNDLKHFTYQDSSFSNPRNNFILTMFMDKSGQIWVGTLGGLMKFDDVGEKIKFYNHELDIPNSLSSNYVYSIYQDKSGKIWIGTANGLNLMKNSSNEFTHFFERDGLPNSVISSILEDSNGNLWISTNKGLSQFDLKTNSFRNFSKTDGLQGDIFYPNSDLKLKNGYLYFGGINGFNYFHPDSLKFSPFVPSLAINSFYYENYEGQRNEVKNFSNIELNYRDNTIHVEFSALDFSNPDNIKYSFYLDGLEKNWNPPSNKNSVTYHDLPPGDYTFKVKSTNSDGLWTGNLLEVRIDIIPPFWNTWWFFTIIIVIIGTLIYFLYNYQLKLKVNHAVEIEKIREQESEKVRSKTVTDFHDELGHTLTRISILTEMTKGKINGNNPDMISTLDKISENSRTLYDGAKDFIWAIDPYKNSFYELMVRLKDFGDDLFNTTKIQFQVIGLTDELKEIQLKMDWKRQLSIIFKAGMINAFRHAGCRQVFLEGSILDQEIEISLVDDGKGFDPKKYFKENSGVGNMRKRAEKISGILEFESKKGIGTKISFRGRITKNISIS